MSCYRCRVVVYSSERVPNDALSASQSLSTQHPGSADVPLPQCLPLPRPWASSSLHGRRSHVQKQVSATRRRVCCQSTHAGTAPGIVPRWHWQKVPRRRSRHALAAPSQAEAAGIAHSGPRIPGRASPASSSRSNSTTSTTSKSSLALVCSIIRRASQRTILQ